VVEVSVSKHDRIELGERMNLGDIEIGGAV
jgi:hypothetical protein